MILRMRQKLVWNNRVIFDILTIMSENENIDLYLEHGIDDVDIIGDGCNSVPLIECTDGNDISNEGERNDIQMEHETNDNDIGNNIEDICV